MCGLRGSSSSTAVNSEAAPVELSWADLTCDVLNVQTMQPKRVLHGASGCIKPGELVALVGPSGAGDRLGFASCCRVVQWSQCSWLQADVAYVMLASLLHC